MHACRPSCSIFCHQGNTHTARQKGLASLCVSVVSVQQGCLLWGVLSLSRIHCQPHICPPPPPPSCWVWFSTSTPTQRTKNRLRTHTETGERERERRENNRCLRPPCPVSSRPIISWLGTVWIRADMSDVIVKASLHIFCRSEWCREADRDLPPSLTHCYHCPTLLFPCDLITYNIPGVRCTCFLI